MKKELFRFAEGSKIWTLTSADSDEEYNGEIYVSTTIGRNEAESKSELSRANLEVSFDIANEMARRWMRQIIDNVVTLTIFSKEDESTSVVWKGRLASVKPEVSAITLVFESIFTSLRRAGLRKKFQRSCPHVLYGRGCFFDRSLVAVLGKLTGLTTDGVTLTVPEAALKPDGWYTAGMIEATDGTFRFITNHVGTQLTLIRPVDSMTEDFNNSGYGMNYGAFYGGVPVTLFPGCDRSKEMCNGKYGNIVNHGGFPFIPLKNPFSGSSIV